MNNSINTTGAPMGAKLEKEFHYPVEETIVQIYDSEDNEYNLTIKWYFDNIRDRCPTIISKSWADEKAEEDRAYFDISITEQILDQLPTYEYIKKYEL